MAAHVRGGGGNWSTSTGAPATLIASTSGIDRYVVVHAAASSSAAINVYLDANSTARVLAYYVNIPAADVRDFGPYFISSTETLRGNTDVPLGTYVVDEQRPG